MDGNKNKNTTTAKPSKEKSEKDIGGCHVSWYNLVSRINLVCVYINIYGLCGSRYTIEFGSHFSRSYRVMDRRGRTGKRKKETL